MANTPVKRPSSRTKATPAPKVQKAAAAKPKAAPKAKAPAKRKRKRKSRAVPGAVLGRPSKYNASIIPELLKLAETGKSLVQISVELDIPRTTLISWGHSHPDFSTALARASDLAQSWWEQQAMDNLKNRDFNHALWHKNVASRFRQEYGDKVALEVDDKRPATPEQRAAKISELYALGVIDDPKRV